MTHVTEPILPIAKSATMRERGTAEPSPPINRGSYDSLTHQQSNQPIISRSISPPPSRPNTQPQRSISPPPAKQTSSPSQTKQRPTSPLPPVPQSPPPIRPISAPNIKEQQKSQMPSNNQVNKTIQPNYAAPKPPVSSGNKPSPPAGPPPPTRTKQTHTSLFIKHSQPASNNSVSVA